MLKFIKECWANSVESIKMASIGAVWSGTSLFVIQSRLTFCIRHTKEYSYRVSKILCELWCQDLIFGIFGMIPYEIKMWNDNLPSYHLPWADNCQELIKFATKHSQTKSLQYQCTYQMRCMMNSPLVIFLTSLPDRVWHFSSSHSLLGDNRNERLSMHSKCPKISYTKSTDKMACAKSADPDQTAPEGAVWSGSTLFAILLCFKKQLHKKGTFRPTTYVIKSSKV